MTVAPKGDGIADDTGAVMDYIAQDLILPPGNFRVTQPLYFTATTSRSPGPRVRGTHRLKSKIIADYDNLNPVNGVVTATVDAAGHYSLGTEVRDITLAVAPGRTGHNGVSLTGAWYVRVHDVTISGTTRHGITTPWRADLNPTLSDVYQCFGVSVKRTEIPGAGGNGIDFAAGQSPGLYIVQHCDIYGCRVGIHSTTGQCTVNQNVVAECAIGGIKFDSVEGPNMVSEVTQNEIQDNLYYGIAVERTRGMYLARNRFLSRVTDTNTTLQTVHVNLGNGLTGEVHSLIAEMNLHRSGGGPVSPCIEAFYGYDASYGSLSKLHPSYIRNNLFGEYPFNGIDQNSMGMRKFVGFNLVSDGCIIVDP